MIFVQSHIEDIKGTKVWDVVQERIIDVMKKTLGIMVFEVCTYFLYYNAKLKFNRRIIIKL